MVQLFGNSIVQIKNSTFFNNTNKLSPSIQASNYLEFEVIDSLFKDNEGFPVADILIQFSNNLARIVNSKFTNFIKGDAIHSEQAPLSLEGIIVSER